MKNEIIDKFHDLYYSSRVWEHTYYFGHQILKCPLDMWIYQELIFELRPKVLVESGTFMGGSALFYAHLFDLIGDGHVVTIDIEPRFGRPTHPRITYLTADSSNPELPSIIKNNFGESEFSLVILDSDHSEAHVTKEINLWHQYIKKDGYLVVEDSNINGHPTRPDFGPGPMEATLKFLVNNKSFEADFSRQKFMMTQNPNGWLKRIF